MSEDKKVKRSERLQDIRTKLAGLRSEIANMRYEDKIWEDWLKPCEGGITCVLTATHGVMEEMRKCEDEGDKE